MKKVLIKVKMMKSASIRSLMKNSKKYSKLAATYSSSAAGSGTKDRFNDNLLKDERLLSRGLDGGTRDQRNVWNSSRDFHDSSYQVSEILKGDQPIIDYTIGNIYSYIQALNI